jgi:phosphoenolpyruvate carboxykinase (ATP)
VDESILDPSKAWETPSRWHVAATDLALKFINNFSKFTANEETAKLAEHGPVI